jgi:hypothetical protein
MYVLSSFFRRASFAVAAFALLAAAAAQPGVAQVRQQIADKAATDAGNKFVAKIAGESCADFAATMAQMKGQGAGASPSPMAAKLKANTQARTTFVNIVAAPLMNKMIDCGMMPGGM